MSKKLLVNYCQENNESLQKKLAKDIKIFLNKKKKTKRKYCHERYKNLLKDEKQKLVEYRKKYYRMRQNASL